MSATNPHCAEAQLLIRKPAAEVFNAFIDPAVTTNFWFTKSSGKLEIGKRITWQWEMYKVSTTVVAKKIIPDKKLIFEWSDPVTTVTFLFNSISDDTTFVTVTECGYDKTGDDLIDIIKGSTGGFTTVLDGCKAFLEHNLRLNLIADKFPLGK
jgi:uncharacterized protein YndB with AHSA1/START domain